MISWFRKVYDESGDGNEYPQCLMVSIKTTYELHPYEYIFIRNFLKIYGSPFAYSGVYKFL